MVLLYSYFTTMTSQTILPQLCAFLQMTPSSTAEKVSTKQCKKNLMHMKSGKICGTYNSILRKCQHISFSRKRVPPQYTYELRDTDITLTTDIKYLGVTVDDKLVWNKRLAIIMTTANSTLGFLRRNIMTKLTSIRTQSYM